LRKVEVCDVSAQMESLLDRVLEGDKVLITRHGIPVAELVPARQRGLTLGSGWAIPTIIRTHPTIGGGQ
jgi:prevent-host-death family protein